MKKYQHGGDVYSNKTEYDFSANINPLGMPESVKIKLRESIEMCEHYPDTESRELIREIALFETGVTGKKVPGDMIVCGNGAADILYRTMALLKPSKVLLPVPSFSEYEKAVKEIGGEIKYYYRRIENDYRVDERILESIEDVDMVIMCNPNNPTGDVTDAELMERIVAECERCRVKLIVDECFMDFADEGLRCRKLYDSENVIIIRAFTKICAMPGIRTGYSISKDKAFNLRLRQTGQCWGVSVPAQVAGAEAARVLRDSDYIKDTRDLIKKERCYLATELEKLGIKVYQSEANYLLFYSERELCETLLKNGIAIRNCENYEGLKKGYYRIAVRKHEDNKRFIKYMQEI